MRVVRLPSRAAIEQLSSALLALCRTGPRHSPELGFEKMAAADARRNEAIRQAAAELARVVTQPKVLLADEPTGDLDAATADRVFTLLQQLHREHGLTSVIVTHNADFARRCDRVLRLSEGQLVPA